MNDIKTFVLLKYEILTYEKSTWHLCNTYPPEVNSKWAWRCAGDVEHLAKGHKEAEECIRIAKLYRDGLATKEELDKAWRGASSASAYYAYATAASSSASTYAASAYAASASTAAGNYAAYAGNYAASSASYASSAFGLAGDAAKKEKWNLYIEWLIEELCIYELSCQK